jgi:hypothetical protein
MRESETKKEPPVRDAGGPHFSFLNTKEAAMIDNISDIYKPCSIEPGTVEHKQLIADLAKRDQHLEPGEQVARHPEYAHIFATSEGRIINAWKRSETKPARIARLYKRQDGYLDCGVTVAFKKQRTVKIHRTVLESFRGPAPEGHETCLHRRQSTLLHRRP